MSLRVLHAPLHAPSAKGRADAVKSRIRTLNPHTAGLSEAYPIVGPLVSTRGYRLVLEQGAKDTRRGQKDCPILVRTGLRSLGSGQVLGCLASTPAKIAPERWMTWSAVQVPGVGPVFHVALHPHAAVQADGAAGRVRVDVDRGRKFVAQMEAFDALLDFADAMGWDTAVTADLNFRDRGADNLSPYRIMRRHGMAVEAHGVDAIGWTKRLGLDVTQVSAPRGVTDHPWLLGVAR